MSKEFTYSETTRPATPRNRRTAGAGAVGGNTVIVAGGGDSASGDIKNHAYTHRSGGTDPLKASDIGAAESQHTHEIDDVNQLPEKLASKHPLGGSQELPLKASDITTKSMRSPNFSAIGFGAGFDISTDDNGISTLTIGRLKVLMEAVFNTLTIHEMRAVSGTIVVSAADAILTRTEDGGSYYKCYYIPNSGVQMWRAGMQARCQRDVPGGLKFYWRLVTSVSSAANSDGEHWFNLSKTTSLGEGVPEVNDNVVLFGHRGLEGQYKNLIVISSGSFDSTNPSIVSYVGIDDFSTPADKIALRLDGENNLMTGNFIVKSPDGSKKPVPYVYDRPWTTGTRCYYYWQVAHIGASWLCIYKGVDGTTAEPSDAAGDYWLKITGKGDPGKGIMSIVDEWAIGNDAVTAPTTGWTTTIPVKPAGKILWNRETVTYTDSTTYVSAHPIITDKGDDGKGISSIINEFAKNTSQTVAPTTGWTTSLPARSAGEIIWVRDKVTYTDNTVAYTAPRPQTGDQGDQGGKGDTGADAVRYELQPSTTIVKMSSDGTLSPSTVNCKIAAILGSRREVIGSGVGRLNIPGRNLARLSGLYGWFNQNGNSSLDRNGLPVGTMLAGSTYVVSGEPSNSYSYKQFFVIYVDGTQSGVVNFGSPFTAAKNVDYFYCRGVANQVCAYSWIKIEVGSVVTANTPAYEDANSPLAITRNGAAYTRDSSYNLNADKNNQEWVLYFNSAEWNRTYTIIDKMSALDYIKNAINDGSTVTDGGLILSNLIMLKNSGNVTDYSQITTALSGANDGIALVADSSDAYRKGVDFLGGNAARRPNALITSDGRLFAKSVDIEGSFRNKMVDYTTTNMLSTSANPRDNVIMPSSATIINSTQFPWDSESIGRRLTLIFPNQFVTINAPAGKYFYERDGQTYAAIRSSKETITMIGYGVGSNFLGWIIESRTYTGTAGMYGMPSSLIAGGFVDYRNNTIRKAVTNSLWVSQTQQTFGLATIDTGRKRIWLPFLIPNNQFGVRLTTAIYFGSTQIESPTSNGYSAQLGESNSAYNSFTGTVTSYFDVVMYKHDGARVSEAGFWFDVYPTYDWFNS